MGSDRRSKYSRRIVTTIGHLATTWTCPADYKPFPLIFILDTSENIDFSGQDMDVNSNGEILMCGSDRQGAYNAKLNTAGQQLAHFILVN